jgi:hypothetical protein
MVALLSWRQSSDSDVVDKDDPPVDLTSIDTVVNFLSIARAIPFGVGIVNLNVCRLGRRRGVSTGVSVVCAHHNENTSADKAKNKRMHGWSMHEANVGRSEALERCTWIHHSTCELLPSPTRPNDVIPMGTQHLGARHAKDVLLLVSVEVFPFRGEPEIPNRELLELTTGEGTKGLFVGCSCTTDVMDHFMSASIIHFVSMNLTNCFEQIGVSYASSSAATLVDTDAESLSPEMARRAWIRLA